MSAGLYVHVPFCLTRCGYCDFNAYSGLDHLAGRYVRALREEADLVAHEWRDVPFYEGSGCFECGGTGFRGRTAIHELLDLSEHIREMILNKRPTSEIRRAAREEGMTFLRESALAKVKLGTSTLKEINKVTFIEG